MYNIHIATQKEFNFDHGDQPLDDALPEQAPNYQEREHANEQITRITDALRSTVHAILIRVLVNGTKGAQNVAMHELFREGINPEQIETELHSVSSRSPKTFPPERVKEALHHIRNSWNKRITDIRKKRDTER